MTDYDDFGPDPVDGGQDPFASTAAVAEDPFGEAEPEAVFDAGFEAAPLPAAAAEEDPFATADGGIPAASEPTGGAEGLLQELALGDPQDAPVLLEASPAQEAALPESAVLGEWQSVRADTLRIRRDEARAKKEAQREKAVSELATFKAEREARLAKVKSHNRDEEKNFVADMASTMANGTQWEKVHKLVNLAPKPNEKPGASKVDRMRNLLIQLKHDN